MSGSPVVSLRRLQLVVLRVTGRHVTTLDLASSLLEAMESGSLRFERDSLVAHRDRLRNWQIADSIIMSAWDRERVGHERPLRTARLDMPALYDVYLERVKEAGLTPFAFATFRIRVYELTLTSATTTPAPGAARVPAP